MKEKNGIPVFACHHFLPVTNFCISNRNTIESLRGVFRPTGLSTFSSGGHLWWGTTEEPQNIKNVGLEEN